MFARNHFRKVKINGLKGNKKNILLKGAINMGSYAVIMDYVVNMSKEAMANGFL